MNTENKSVNTEAEPRFYKTKEEALKALAHFSDKIFRKIVEELERYDMLDDLAIADATSALSVAAYYASQAGVDAAMYLEEMKE